MANTKTSILDALATQLQNSASVGKATRVLLPPAEARDKSPYVGMIAGTEEVVVEDATDIRYELEVNLLLIKKGRDIEAMLDGVKNVLYGASLASTIGAYQVAVIGQQEVTLVQDDNMSSTRIMVVITYAATKGSF